MRVSGQTSTRWASIWLLVNFLVSLSVYADPVANEFQRLEREDSLSRGQSLYASSAQEHYGEDALGEPISNRQVNRAGRFCDINEEGCAKFEEEEAAAAPVVSKDSSIVSVSPITGLTDIMNSKVVASSSMSNLTSVLTLKNIGAMLAEPGIGAASVQSEIMASLLQSNSTLERLRYADEAASKGPAGMEALRDFYSCVEQKIQGVKPDGTKGGTPLTPVGAQLECAGGTTADRKYTEIKSMESVDQVGFVAANNPSTPENSSTDLGKINPPADWVKLYGERQLNEISLVDELYNHRMKSLVASAEAAGTKLEGESLTKAKKGINRRRLGWRQLVGDVYSRITLVNFLGKEVKDGDLTANGAIKKIATRVVPPFLHPSRYMAKIHRSKYKRLIVVMRTLCGMARDEERFPDAGTGAGRDAGMMRDNSPEIRGSALAELLADPDGAVLQGHLNLLSVSSFRIDRRMARKMYDLFAIEAYGGVDCSLLRDDEVVGNSVVFATAANDMRALPLMVRYYYKVSEKLAYIEYLNSFLRAGEEVSRTNAGFIPEDLRATAFDLLGRQSGVLDGGGQVGDALAMEGRVMGNLLRERRATEVDLKKLLDSMVDDLRGQTGMNDPAGLVGDGNSGSGAEGGKGRL